MLKETSGEGKTSLGQSIVRALSHIAHDVRDEAEMRGHHRTFATRPGLLARTLLKAGRMDPVLLCVFITPSASLQIYVGDDGIGEINKVDQSNYQGVARGSLSGENHSMCVFSNLHLEPFFLLGSFYGPYGRSGRLNVLNNVSQVSSIYRRTASYLTIASPLLDRGWRGDSIVQAHAGQLAAYCAEVPSPATRVELLFRDVHSTDRVSPPPNGLALRNTRQE